MKEILLNSAKNTTNVEVENGEYISLSTKQCRVPTEKIEGIINHYELYLKERNSCKNYKMFFTIHPYMSNVLPNAFTEVIYNEGAIASGIITPSGELEASHRKFFKRSINNIITKSAIYNNEDFISNTIEDDIDRRYQMIRDTEYTHPQLGILTYHCGLDIFNNHYLRSNGFFRIKYNATSNEQETVFNTIKDYLVYYDGTIAEHVREAPGEPKTFEIDTGANNIFQAAIKWLSNQTESTVTNKVKRKTHMFNHQNILSVAEAFKNNIKEENGWIGFYNKSYLPEYDNFSNLVLNRCFNDKDACSFIEMYPDRTLFSFLPKINDNFGLREEYNWDWCLTYPSERTMVDSNGDYFDFFNEYGLQIIWGSTTELYAKNGDEYTNVLYNDNCYNIMREKNYVYFRTKCKHNLQANDSIKLSYRVYDAELGRETIRDFSLNVLGLGDETKKHKHYYFYVSYDDLSDEFGENRLAFKDDNNPTEVSLFYTSIPKEIYVSKIINGVPCEYYVRKFRKIGYFHSTMNKVAFSNTIFNDNIAQILYDDNINVSGLKDNLGRDISEIFITFIKRNKGHEKYYLSGVTSPVSVEYSHCFGKVTTGFNFECDESERDVIIPDSNTIVAENFRKYNIRSLYNLENFGNTDRTKFITAMGINFKPPTSIEKDVTNKYDVFYGDFVEFSPSTVTEIIIEDVYHRFNTAQRETKLNNDFFKFDRFRYDELVFDDYDFNMNMDNNETPRGITEDEIPEFTVSVNHDGFRKNVPDDYKEYIQDNIFPEGYFYKPHHRVKLKEYSSELMFDYDILIAKEGDIDISNEGPFGKYCFTNDEGYRFTSDDKLIFYYEDGRKKEYYVYPSKYEDKIAFYEYNKTLDKIVDGLKYVFCKNKDIPEYAYYVGDGSGKYIWRPLINDTELSQDSDIYDRMYANGAVYINTDINFYLRRQDPYGLYGLQYTSNGSSASSYNEDIVKFNISGVEVNKGDSDYITEENYSICEI